jgi:hypothetical protein
MFEAGALSKNIGRAKVVPILVDVEPADVLGPLMQFQCARFEESEIQRVLRMLNSELKDLSLSEDILESVFAMWWPVLQENVGQMIQQRASTESAVIRPDRDLLEEMVGLARSIARRQSEEISPPYSGPSAADWGGALTLPAVVSRLQTGGNLAGANLMALNLARLNMSGANLRGANLVGANLSDTNLEDANLDAANLEGAILDRAELRGAQISRTNLWHASMRAVKNLDLVKSMNEANFFEVDLNDVDREAVATQNTLAFGSYPELLGYYRGEKEMPESELRAAFLWTSRSYPGEMQVAGFTP